MLKTVDLYNKTKSYKTVQMHVLQRLQHISTISYAKFMKAHLF